ncbi:MAG: DNA repair and recombination protein RadB [archaeon]|nr:DNA repair and recombination protein RadB [archaeon]
MKEEKISAGSHDLNKWLLGGYERDIITVFYGGPGTGKTNLCLLAAVSQAKKGNKVIFVDTEGGFSVERVKQISGENYEKVLKNILLLKPTDFSEQKKVFDKLYKNLKKEASLIIVDGMAILYRLDLALARENGEDKMREINSELVRQMKILAEIARKRNIPILVTNQVYKWEDGQRMVGGDILRYWAKCLIELENKEGSRRIYLRKHRSIKEKNMGFQITNDGVKKRGWL